MCLIIKKPPGRRISEDFLLNAWQRNAHGWGSFSAQQGQVRWHRGLHLEDLLAHNRTLADEQEVYVHLRKATHGDINEAMAHPHMVRPDLLLMHNGSIDQLAPADRSLSDTHELARLLANLLGELGSVQAAGLIRSEGFRRLVAPLIEGSLLILLDTHGPVHLGRQWHTVTQEDWDEVMSGFEVSNRHTWGREASLQP